MSRKTAKCPGCKRLLIDLSGPPAIVHTVLDDRTGKIWHADCWRGEVPDTLKGFYAAESKLKGRPDA